MGLISDLVKMKSDQDLKAKQGPLDVAKLVLSDENATPQAREWAINSVATLLEGDFGGKGKGSGGGGGRAASGGGGGGIGSFFKTLLGGISNMNPYTAGKGTKREVGQVNAARPQKLELTEDERAAVKAKQAAAEFEIQQNQEEQKAQTERRRKLSFDQDYHERRMKEGQQIGLTGAQLAEYADPEKMHLTADRAAGATGTYRAFWGKINGQGEELQQLFINNKDPGAGYIDANGNKYTKEQVSGLTTSPPPPQKLYGRPLEISQAVQAKGWKVGTPEYDHWVGVISAADLQASIGRLQQAGAIAGFESGIPLGQGFPAIPENPNKKKEETTAPSAPATAPVEPTATPGKPPLSSRAAPATPASVSNAPADDRFQSMYLASLMSDAPVAGGAARVGVIKGRESFKKVLGLSAADFSMIEAANKDQRKGLADTIQRAVATQRVNDILSEFGDEAVKRAKNILNTNSPLLNKPIRSIELSTVGDPDIRRFLISLNAFQRQYGILTSGSPQSRAQIPVSVGEKVDKIIDPNATLSEVISTVDQVKIEGKQEAQGFKNAAKETIDSITGSLKPKSAGGGAQGTPTRTATGPNGEKLGLIDGKWVPISK